MNQIQNLTKNFNPTDFVVFSFYIFLSALTLVFSYTIDYWYIIIFLNSALISFVIWISNKANKSQSNFWKNLHYYYVIPIIFLTFKEVYVLISSVHSMDYDHILIAADRFLFGGDPTVFLYQFANPVFTEILQIAYGTFFFLPILLGIEFQLKKEFDKFYYIIFSVVFGFFLSYLAYFLLPAVGPRFTLHDFALTDIEIPGLFLTDFLREIVNSGESIPSGTPNPIEVVQRDVFPSGHTMMTLIVMFLAVKLKSKNKIFFLVDGTLLIFATVYLRYHYVIDVIGGTIFMVISLILGKIIFNWWQKKTNKTIFEY